MVILWPAVRSMMTALVSSWLEAPAGDGYLRPACTAAIKKFIRNNYRNHALDVDAVVAYSFPSRRSLHHPFEDEGLQVNGYIRALRTLEAIGLLTDPRDVPSGS